MIWIRGRNKNLEPNIIKSAVNLNQKFSRSPEESHQYGSSKRPNRGRIVVESSIINKLRYDVNGILDSRTIESQLATPKKVPKLNRARHRDSENSKLEKLVKLRPRKYKNHPRLRYVKKTTIDHMIEDRSPSGDSVRRESIEKLINRYSKRQTKYGPLPNPVVIKGDKKMKNYKTQGVEEDFEELTRNLSNRGHRSPLVARELRRSEVSPAAYNKRSIRQSDSPLSREVVKNRRRLRKSEGLRNRVSRKSFDSLHKAGMQKLPVLQMRSKKQLSTKDKLRRQKKKILMISKQIEKIKGELASKNQL